MPKILVISMRIPFPPHSGYQGTMLNFLKAFSALNYSIDLICVEDDKKNQRSEYLEKIREEVKGINSINCICLPLVLRLLGSFLSYLTGRPLQTGYFSNIFSKRKVNALTRGRQYDEIFIHTVRLFDIIPGELRKNSTLFYADSISMNYYTALPKLGGLKKLLYFLEMSRLKKYEQRVYKEVRAAIFHNLLDVEFLELQTGYHIIPIVKPIVKTYHPVTVETKKRFLFIGKLSYLPNEMAVKSLAEFMARRPNAGFSIEIIGGDLSPQLTELINKIDGIKYLGKKENLHDEVIDSYGVLSPIEIGAGMTNKILDALVHGRPAIASNFSALPYRRFFEYKDAFSTSLEAMGIFTYSDETELDNILTEMINKPDLTNTFAANSFNAAKYFDVDLLKDMITSVFDNGN